VEGSTILFVMSVDGVVDLHHCLIKLGGTILFVMSADGVVDLYHCLMYITMCSSLLVWGRCSSPSLYIIYLCYSSTRHLLFCCFGILYHHSQLTLSSQEDQLLQLA
jgi:hypothetical protein